MRSAGGNFRLPRRIKMHMKMMTRTTMATDRPTHTMIISDGAIVSAVDRDKVAINFLLLGVVGEFPPALLTCDEVDLQVVTAVVIHHGAIVAAKVLRLALPDDQRRLYSLGQWLLENGKVVVVAAVDLMAVEGPEDMPRLGHAERDAMHLGRVADESVLPGGRGNGRRSLQVDRGLCADIRKAHDARLAVVFADSVAVHRHGEVRRIADNLSMDEDRLIMLTGMNAVNGVGAAGEWGIINTTWRRGTYPVGGIMDPDNIRRRIAVHVTDE